MEQTLEFIDQLDKDWLLYLQNYNSAILDTIMATSTRILPWIPLFIILIAALFKQFGWQALYSIVAIVVLITLTDQITSSFMKPFFGRYRPCHDPEIGHLVRIVTRCGGEFGFVSGHAANSFSIATFFILLFGKTYRYVWWVLIWPLLFSYSRIYLGVHYPMDILGGAIVGILLGYLVYTGTKRLSTAVPFSFAPTIGK